MNFLYDYIKPKYQNNARLCYIDTDSFIIYAKTEGFYQDISNDVEKRFVTSSYGVKRPKTYSYLMDNGNSDKKSKATKLCNKTKT